MIYLIVALGFLVRVLPRAILPNVLVSDTYFHLYCAEVIREKRLRLPRSLPRIILKHRYDYPFLYHLLLACFSLPGRLWVERLTGAIFDSLSLIIVYLFTSWLVRESGAPIADLPLWVSALYAFSPALLRLGSGPRAYNGSPRTMGQMLYLLHLTLAYYALTANNLLALGGSIAAGAALICTAVFGNQVLIFFGLFFIVLISYKYLFALFACLLIAVLLTKGRAWDVLIGQTRHSVFYARHLQSIFIFPFIRSFKDYAGSGVKTLFQTIRHFDIKHFLRWYYRESHPLHLLLTVFPQFVLLFLVVWQQKMTAPSDLFLFVWAAGGFLWFVITKFKYLLFLGEGERYLEYALFPSLVLVTRFMLPDLRWGLYAFLAYSVISAVYYQFEYLGQCRNIEKNDNESEPFWALLNNLPPGVIMPIGSLHWRTVYCSRFPVLTHGCNIDERLISRDEFMLIYGKYPYPSGRFDEIVTKYDVSYLVSDPVTLKYYGETIMQQPDRFRQMYEVLWESPGLIIAKVLR